MLVLDERARSSTASTYSPGRHDSSGSTRTGSPRSTTMPGRCRARSSTSGGMTLMPGLITCHLHPDFYKFDIFAGEKPGKELPPGVMMAIGVRTCRVLWRADSPATSALSCAHDIDVQLKMAIAQDIIPGPRIRACGHHIGTTGDMNNRSAGGSPTKRRAPTSAATVPTRCGSWSAKRSVGACRRSRSFASAGHGIPGRMARNMARDEIDTIVTAAHERGAKVRAHVADKQMMLECIELGVDILDHGDEIDEECIEKMVGAGTFWVPSLVYLWSLLEVGYAEQFGVTRAMYDRVRAMLPVAQRAGVRILIGDDYSGVFRHHDQGRSPRPPGGQLRSGVRLLR